MGADWFSSIESLTASINETMRFINRERKSYGHIKMKTFFGLIKAALEMLVEEQVS
jgi:molybdate-binding protein